MTVTCTLSDLVSWFVCAEQYAYFGELLTAVVFIVVFRLSSDSSGAKDFSYNDAVVSLFAATMVALALYGIGAANGAFALACVVLTGLAALANKL